MLIHLRNCQRAPYETRLAEDGAARRSRLAREGG
jgi:hypothetical protein